MPFVEHMRYLSRLNILVNAKELNMDRISDTIQKLRENFFYLQEIFDISETLKMHIIFYHYEEYLLKTGKPSLV